VRSVPPRTGNGNGDAGARSLPNLPKCASFFAAAARTTVRFRPVRAITRGRFLPRAALAVCACVAHQDREE